MLLIYKPLRRKHRTFFSKDIAYEIFSLKRHKAEKVKEKIEKLAYNNLNITGVN